MNKALSMGKTSASGSFWVFMGKIISAIILTIGTIVLGLFIGEDEYGLYAIALIPSVTLLLFQDWGVSSAVTKFCAQFRGTKEEENLNQLIKAGLMFALVSGLLLALVSAISANFLAVSIFNKSVATIYITIASSTILSISIMIGTQSVFVGFEKMKYYSIVIIFQAVAQSSLSPLLVYMGYGTMGAIVGYTTALIFTASFSLAILYFGLYTKLKKPKIKIKITKMMKKLLNYGIPLGFSNILSGIDSQFYSFIMAAYVTTVLIGNYRMANNFALFVSFFAVPISTVLFPAFSKIDPTKDKSLFKSVFSSSVKFTSLFVLPATLGMVVLSGPLVATLFGDRWSFAALFLSLSVLHNLFSFFGTLSINSLLAALGETKMLMKINLIVLAIGVPLSFLIIPQYGVPGLILVSLIALSPAALYSVYWTWKKYEIKAEFSNSGKLLLASGVSAIITYFFLQVFITSPVLQLLIGALLFVISYIFFVPFFGAINYTDICDLRTMFSGLGIVAKVLEIPLLLMTKISKIKENRKN